MPSEQVSVGVVQTLSTQLLLLQSPSTTQASPSAQASQILPPQSTSVSSWLVIPSEQVSTVGVVQTLSTQLLLLQSPSTTQARPSAQASQMLPPQSTSVSSWLVMPSEQVSAGVVQTLSTQLSLLQSLLIRQARPSAQGPQILPPQSTSVSSWLVLPSEQVSMIWQLESQVAVPAGSHCSVTPSPLRVCSVPSPQNVLVHAPLPVVFTPSVSHSSLGLVLPSSHSSEESTSVRPSPQQVQTSARQSAEPTLLPEALQAEPGGSQVSSPSITSSPHTGPA